MIKEFRARWAQRGYGGGMGSAEVMPPPLKEFLRVYNLLPATHALSNIALGRMKVSRISELNDPFEFLAFKLSDRQFRTVWEELRKHHDLGTGICCFSSNWTCPPLWSHYADRHRGIGLGFDVRKNHVREVEYVANRLIAPPQPVDLGEIDREDLVFSALTKKARPWSYESEWRSFVSLQAMINESGMYFRPFDQDFVLREVILGPVCPLTLADVRAVVSQLHPHAITFRSRLAVKSFGVVPDEDTVRELPIELRTAAPAMAGEH